jgi:CBS domain-containing protein
MASEAIMSYRVSDVMTPNVVALSPEDNLALASDVLQLERIRHLPVVENGRVVGLVTHRDLLRALASHERTRVAKDAMTRAPRCVRPGTPLRRAVRIMLDNKFGCLPVVDARNQLVGIVTESDILTFALALTRDLECSAMTLEAAERSTVHL